MPLQTLQWYCLTTGKQRITIQKKLKSLQPVSGENNSKCYESTVALELIYVGDTVEIDGEFVPKAEVDRRNVLARTRQIEVDTETAQRKRIPLADIEAVNEETLSNMAGMIKARLGKVMEQQQVDDLLTELRGLGRVDA